MCCSGASVGTPRPDAILAVIDATRLYQGLYLLQQLVELGVPMVVALTMSDAAQQEGIKIDVDRLAERLGGVPRVSGRRDHRPWLRPAEGGARGGSGRGAAAANRALGSLASGGGRAAQRRIPPRGAQPAPRRNRARADRRHRGLGAAGRVSSSSWQARARRCLASSPRSRSRRGSDTAGSARLLRPCSRRGRESRAVARRLLDWVNRPWPSTALFVVTMGVVFQAVFAWATYFMDLIDAGFSGLRLRRHGVASAGHARELPGRRRDRGRRQRHHFLAANPDPVPVHHHDGGHRVPRAGRVPRRSRDALRGFVRAIRHPVVVELRVRGAMRSWPRA